MRPKSRIVGVALSVVAVGWLGMSLFSGSKRSTEAIVATPLILEATQKLGQLRTARHEFSRVMEIETHREPEEWARYVPGAVSLVHSSTRNSGLVRTQGYVEAGVDLSRAKVIRHADHYVVQVPSARVLGVEANAWIVHQSRGMLWRDENLSAKGVAQAKREYKAASIQKGILNEANSEAKERLMSLLGGITDKPIQVEMMPNL
jgi:hypothetical protein